MRVRVIERAHYGPAYFDLIDSYDYSDMDDRPKPRGLWYSAPTTELQDNGYWREREDGWEHWNAVEGYAPIDCKHLLELDLSRLLVIDNVVDLLVFGEDWRRPGVDPCSWEAINWPALRDAYAGIEIAPYQWSQRLKHETRWYYGWDVSSGCVWDLSAITSWKPADA